MRREYPRNSREKSGDALSPEMEYRSYSARVIYDDDDRMLRGRVEGIRNVVTFVAESVDALEKEFHVSVDEYLDFCSEQGIAPEKPGSEPARRAAS
jgi:predicted HicB family RNase H-like nuclease